MTNGLAETNEDNVTVSKTVRETGTENEFEITLQVTTREKLEEIPTSSDSAVVLVMDTSGSMGGSRLTAAKDAAKKFVDKYVKDSKPTDKRYAALVEFANDAETVSGWTNLAQGTGNFEDAIDNLYVNYEFLIGYTGGTNMEGGLQLAYNLINSAKGENGLLKDVKNVNIILMSDGCPTFHVKANTRNSLTKIEGAEGGGNVACYVDWKPVETLASTITSANINLYSVAFQTGKADFENRGFVETEAKHRSGFSKYDCTEEGERHWQMVNGVRKHGYWTYYWNVSNWMNSFSTKGFTASNADDLTIKFDNIAKLIKLGAQAWKVTDPMGQFIEYAGAASDTAADHNRFTYADGILRWDLKSSTPEVSEAGDTTTYTYTLTYPITLNTAAEGFEAGKAYATNGTTTLSYYLFSKVDDTTKVPDTPKTLNFDVPTVKGYLGSLSFRKVDQDGNALSGASFAISNTSLTGVSDTNGNVTIEGIPSGFNYTLTETKMDGYTALEPIAFKVSYGVVSKANGDPLETVINTKEANPKYIVVKHEYYDAEGYKLSCITDENYGHMVYKEGLVPDPDRIYDYDGKTYEAWGETAEWSYDAEDADNMGKHDDYVITLKYKQKSEVPEVKDYVVIIHKYFDADDNLVAEVRDTDFDHMLDKEGFQPEPETTYDGVEYAIRDSYDGWVLNTTDNAVGEVHNDHVFTIEYQVKDDGPRYSKIRVNHEYYTDGNHDGTEIEEFDYSEDFAPTQKPEYSEKTYTYVSTTGPKDIGDGYLEYTLVYRRTTELPPNPPVVDDTIIVIEKSWDGAVYDGDITFTATNEKTGRTYTGTLRAGRNRAVITVPAGGTYIISEDVPEGYTPSFPEGDTVYVRTGSSATIYVVNSGEEEEEIEDDDTPLAPGPVDPVKPGDSDEVIDDETTPLVDPPKTGAAVRGLSVLFGAAAAALVGAVVLRKKKEK